MTFPDLYDFFGCHSSRICKQQHERRLEIRMKSIPQQVIIMFESSPLDSSNNLPFEVEETRNPMRMQIGVKIGVFINEDCNLLL